MEVHSRKPDNLAPSVTDYCTGVLIPQSRRLVLICGEAVAIDNSAGLQFRSENVSDIGLKGLTIHCLFDDPPRDQIVVH